MIKPNKNKKKERKEDLKLSEQSIAASACTNTDGRAPNRQHFFTLSLSLSLSLSLQLENERKKENPESSLLF